MVRRCGWIRRRSSEIAHYHQLGLGVIDHCDSRVETADDVVRRAESAMQYVEAGRITLNPDCGFSPGSQNPMDLDEAYAKLRSLSAGAAVLKGDVNSV